jgi:hypothetical protein
MVTEFTVLLSDVTSQEFNRNAYSKQVMEIQRGDEMVAFRTQQF